MGGSVGAHRRFFGCRPGPGTEPGPDCSSAGPRGHDGLGRALARGPVNTRESSLGAAAGLFGGSHGAGATPRRPGPPHLRLKGPAGSHALQDLPGKEAHSAGHLSLVGTLWGFPALPGPALAARPEPFSVEFLYCSQGSLRKLQVLSRVFLAAPSQGSYEGPQVSVRHPEASLPGKAGNVRTHLILSLI